MNKDNFFVEIFIKISNHLLTQNKKSVNSAGKCLYKTSSGLRCAAGCLIPDKDYDPKMEGDYINGDVKNQLISKFFKDSGFSEKEIYLIRELQWVHDTKPIKSWRNELNLIAKKFEIYEI